MRAQTFFLSALAALPWASAQSSSTSTSSMSMSSSSSAMSMATCQPEFTNPPPSFYLCGQQGLMSKPNVINSTTADSALTCGSLCMNNPNCKTFGYSTVGNGTCTLSNKSFPQQGFSVNDAATMRYWNVHCLGCASTATSTSSSAAPTATKHGRCPTTTFTSNKQTYLRYFMGAGKTEDPRNPGNDNSAMPGITTTLQGNYWDDCSAIQMCVDLATTRSFIYYSLDVHWLSNTQQWQCIQYYDPNNNPAWFNVTNKQAYVSYGFYNPDY